MTDHDTPTQRQTRTPLNIRGGLKRLAIAITVIYAGAFLLWLGNSILGEPLLHSAIPAVRMHPNRDIGPTESQNPEIQFLLTLIQAREGGGIQYSDSLIRRLRPSDAFRTIPELEEPEVRLARRAESDARTNPTAPILLPGPEGPLQLERGLAFAEAKQRLENALQEWRWDVTFTSGRACIHGGYECVDRAFTVDPSIHCQARTQHPFYSSKALLDWLRLTCGDLATDLGEMARAKQSAVWAGLGMSILIWFLVWLGAFAFGKGFWWIAAGFQSPKT